MVALFAVLAVIVLIAGILAICYVSIIMPYDISAYKEITHNSYFTTMADSGKYGEYEIYRSLSRYESQGYKFLFNLYLPKPDGRTSEIDVVMISPEGVFVFESKNFNGWIFGNDRQRYWTQVLNKDQKARFYNPVWQNRTHCNVLKGLLPQNAVVHSVVLFSNRCTFKNVTVKATDVIVAHRYEASAIVSYYLQYPQPVKLDVNLVYNTLYPYSQAPEYVKQAHWNEINKYNAQLRNDWR